MKRGFKSILIFGAPIITIAVICIVYISQLNIYKLSPKISNIVTGYTPREFHELRGKDTALENNFTYSKVDGDGNLILILTDNEKRNWEKQTDTPMLNIAREAGNIEISPDYTQCTIRCYRETVTDDLISFVVVLPECVFFQVLNGQDSNNIKVTCQIFDANTGQLKYSAVYPDEEIEFFFATEDFSSMN